MKVFRILSALLPLGLVACGGGGGGGGGATPPPPPPPPAALSGQFKFGNAAGVTYTTASRSGTTDALGTFLYTAGESVELSIGGVVIGSASGRQLLTPYDLVAGGTADSQAVQNIARFLLMLDENEDPDDGIAISANVQQAAGNWAQVDFDTNDLEDELVTIISDVASVDNRAAALPDATVAREEIADDAYCVMSGFFFGDLAGDRTVRVVLNMNPATGQITAFYDGAMTTFVSSPVSLSNSRTFVATAGDGSGNSFEGGFDSYNQVSGVWTIDNTSGTFSVDRRLPDSTAAYVFTGRFYRRTVGTLLDGPLVINVDDQGAVVVDSHDFNFGQNYRASGTFTNGLMSYDYGDGQEHTGMPDENLYIVGSGRQVNLVNRPWFAQGCKLN